MSIINEKSEVYQNCSKCGKSSNETFRCIKCQKVFCKNEVGDKVRIGGGYVIKVERCKDCQKEFKKLVAWWVIENNQNFKLCQPCSDKENKRIWDESLRKYKQENPSEEKEKMEIDYWKAFFS